MGDEKSVAKSTPIRASRRGPVSGWSDDSGKWPSHVTPEAGSLDGLSHNRLRTVRSGKSQSRPRSSFSRPRTSPAATGKARCKRYWARSSAVLPDEAGRDDLWTISSMVPPYKVSPSASRYTVARRTWRLLWASFTCKRERSLSRRLAKGGWAVPRLPAIRLAFTRRIAPPSRCGARHLSVAHTERSMEYPMDVTDETLARYGDYLTGLTRRQAEAFLDGHEFARDDKGERGPNSFTAILGRAETDLHRAVSGRALPPSGEV